MHFRPTPWLAVGRAAEHPRRGIAGGIAVIALGAWALAAPLLFGADEAARWGWHPLELSLVPGGLAVLGGLVMLTARPRGVHLGGLLALAGGACLILASVTGPLWAGDGFDAAGSLDDSTALMVWIGFFSLAGVLVGAFAAYALGYLDALACDWRAFPLAVGGRLDEPSSCQGRHRRATAPFADRSRTGQRLSRPARGGFRPT